MKQRVIFVGMHNKPGLAPLCSSTKSGKLIDRIIKELPEYECLKSNLWNLNTWPKYAYMFNYEWMERVDYKSGDIVVTLGECVRKSFLKSNIEYIHIGHPSAVWSHKKQDDYILKTLLKIQAVPLLTK